MAVSALIHYFTLVAVMWMVEVVVLMFQTLLLYHLFVGVS